jgi:hypothetical protein
MVPGSHGGARVGGMARPERTAARGTHASGSPSPSAFR